MKIFKKDRKAYSANIDYLLSKIGTCEGILFGWAGVPVWKTQTKLGTMHFWATPDSSVYRLNGEFIPDVFPLCDDPVFYLLKDEYYPGIKQFFFFRKEADISELRSWEVAYEVMARKLCLLIHGHITTAKAIAAEGRVEDFLPDSGHVLVGQKKMTVAAFKKKYYVALGNECRLYFDRQIVLEEVPWSLFSLEDVQELTIIAK